jgi:hypothetical protein
MKIARKLALNFGPRAMFALGLPTYLRYLLAFFTNIRAIFRVGNFAPLDRAMGAHPITVRSNGNDFVIDCPLTDQRVQDGSFTFGIMRELYIRNCYLRYGVSHFASKARTVLDLGANRGLFSIMMARQVRLVIAVDLNPLFKEVIEHNMAINGFANYAVEVSCVGGGGACGAMGSSGLTISDLLQKHSLDVVDLVKMDIEGSEFELFRSPEWLSRVSALCMEVHPKYGNPQEIITALERHAFDYVVADQDFRPVENLERAVFIYAWTRNSKGCSILQPTSSLV